MSQSGAVTVHEAKTHLSRLLRRVESGETVTIARGNKPIAKLVPIGPNTSARVLGADAGKGWIADDFDQMPDDLQLLFDDGGDTE